MKIQESQIEMVVSVCPYCMNDWNETKDIYGCCGEVHSEIAFVVDGSAYLGSQVEIEEAL